MNARILFGVPVYTMDEKRSVEEALVISGSKVQFAGAADEAFRLYPEAERTELNSGCILPGFIDSHLHLKDYSLLFRDLDLSDLREPQEIIAKVGEAVSKKGENEWVVGGGVDYLLLEGITRSDLDEVSGQNPLVLYSRDQHSVLVNSAALRESGIDEFRNDPMGGRIERDAKSIPSGILRERAVDLVKREIPEETPGKVDAAIERGMKKLLSKGITCFCDCSIYSVESSLRNLMKVWGSGRMRIRAVQMFGDRDASRLGTIGLQSGFGNEFIRIGGCKVIIDGSLASRTGYMSKPYRGGEDHGMLLMNEKELYEVLKRSYSHYMWTAIHAIGDKANEIALNAYEQLEKERGIPGLLKRIEHAQSLKDEDINRFSTLGVIAVVNPSHIPFDREHAIKFLGAEAKLLHRLGSLVSSGAAISIASDAPVGPVNPFHGIYHAVERKDFDDGPELRFFPKERISVIDAVYACTMGGASALDLDRELGSLEAGKNADLVRLSTDIFSHGTEVMRDVEVLQTFVGGEMVYEKTAKGEHDPSGSEIR